MKNVISKPKTVAYVRVSTDEQDFQNQRFEILNYCDKNKLKVNKWLELEMSSRNSPKDRRIDELLSVLNPGDRLIVSELSRLGRSTGEVIQLVREFATKHVEFISIKQGLKLSSNNSHDMTSKVMVTIFSLLAELERDLISHRTKIALARAKTLGKKLGGQKVPVNQGWMVRIDKRIFR